MRACRWDIWTAAHLHTPDYESHPASSEAIPATMMMMVCTSIADHHLLSLPRPGNSGKYTGDYVGSRLSGRAAIPALYQPGGIRQRTAANRVGHSVRLRCDSPPAGVSPDGRQRMLGGANRLRGG